ncbi:gamma-glutamyl-gamma-aminobutyrate hydrolase family protein [Oceanirhabdus seepicola]|uniref:Gamma-glutamyl-gamma-aminobutyrate hydrolase family protein n=1 Tax=Oceanirhabdus seepicola TaxID=2828781 RepID=A0A9J6P3H7_9CLOT|nr:gamma-glutamyl-gamma-aminobutyrate hydrolase family protein [Oceanirhabdus seepicola]MCM1991362.1 gamma-glutamyl-gamma-aminobutyrate hydrolase family protein [Oceanirhabdus seepicola]
MKKVGITTINYVSNLGFYSNGVNKQYQDKIIEAGGIPILIPLHENNDYDQLEKFAEFYSNDLDMLLLVGGTDITPTLYNALIDKECGDFDIDRDTWEMLLIQKFMSKSKPIMGICRGFQLINVALGGTLIQHMDNYNYSKHWHNINRTHQKAHDVSILGNTLLKTLGEKVNVNSFHHQCIEHLAAPLKENSEIGISSDDVIEIIFNESLRILGVQWHPEMLHRSSETDSIFQLFMSLATNNNVLNNQLGNKRIS